MASYVGKITSNGVSYPITSSLVGVSTTAADVAEKVVTCDDFDYFIDNVSIKVKFTYSNTATDPTININNLGAKPIFIKSGVRAGNTSGTSWLAGAMVSMTYDGTGFIIDNFGSVDVDSTPTQNSTNAVSSGGVYDALELKQDNLTFDSTPTAGSDNPVTSGGIQTALDLKLDASLKGANSGLAELDATGRVPSSQLPSYVDDTIEGYLNDSDGKFYEEDTYTTEIEGETGKIYVTLDTNLTYRWSGSQFVEISVSLALGETSSTAYPGDKGKTAYDTAGANKSSIGDLSNLSTTDKTSLVNAINEIKSADDDKISSDQIGAANGIASLDANTHVPLSQLDSTIVNSVTIGTPTDTASNITAFSAGTAATSSVEHGVLTLTDGTAPTLTYDSKDIPSISSTPVAVAKGDNS